MSDEPIRKWIISERKNGLSLHVMNHGATYNLIPDTNYYAVIEAEPALARIKELEATSIRHVATIFQKNCEIKDLEEDNASLVTLAADAQRFAVNQGMERELDFVKIAELEFDILAKDKEITRLKAQNQKLREQRNQSMLEHGYLNEEICKKDAEIEEIK
jgi:hypothetical protein